MEIDVRRAARTSALRSAVVVILLLLAFCLLPLRGDHWWVGAAMGAAALLSLLPLTVRRLRRLMKSNQPLLELLEALALLLTMLVVGFAAVYFGMDRNGDQFAGLEDRVDAIYFTVTTLGTVGFGDVAAVGRAARVVVTVQIIFDLVFIGFLVRVLSSTARRRADTRGYEV